MLRHIITWKYKEGLGDEENRANALKIKSGFESLAGVIDGIVEIKVYINELPTSNKDIILTSLFVNEAALAAYKDHPEHVKVRDVVRDVLQDRACIDYYER